MGLGFTKYALFQIISLIYIILVMIVYFSKKKIMTLENYIFSIMITVVFLTLLFDINTIILPGVISAVGFLKFLNRVLLLLYILWFALFSYYIFVSASKRNQGFVAFKDNTEAEHFKHIAVYFGFILTVLGVLCFTLELDLDPNNMASAIGPANT